MQVPFLDLSRLEENFLPEWTKKIAQLSKKVSFIGGAEIEILQNNLSQFCQTKAVIPCANGTDALQLALRAVGVEKLDKVLLPNFTFWGTFEAIVNVGGIPIAVDIDREDLQMDFSRFQEEVQKHKPKVAILVHLYGSCSRYLQQYRDFCKKEGLILIEDGAQSFGTSWIPPKATREESIYHGAHIATVSFYPAKVYGAAGDAGAVLTNDKDLAETVVQLGNHGRSQHYSYDHCGWNSRMDSLQAAYLNCTFPFLPARLESRKKIQRQYEKLFRELKIQYLTVPENITPNAYLNVILIEKKKRDKLRKYLTENGIGHAIVYPETMSQQVGAQKYLLPSEKESQAKPSCAEKVCEEVLSLPQFPYMTQDEFAYIQKKLKIFFAK